jgi:hypothetical protein
VPKVFVVLLKSGLLINNLIIDDNKCCGVLPACVERRVELGFVCNTDQGGVTFTDV